MEFSPEMREHAVRLGQEYQDEYPSSLWAAVPSITPKIGCSTYTLTKWVRNHEVAIMAFVLVVTTEESERIQALEREVKELRRVNEILKSASVFLSKLRVRLSLRRRSTAN